MHARSENLHDGARSAPFLGPLKMRYAKVFLFSKIRHRWAIFYKMRRVAFWKVRCMEN
jgi:hypothetical protein